MAFVSRWTEFVPDLLIAVTVCILPRSERDRYRDEWHSTLDDMRAQQIPTLGFAFSMLLHAPSFRRAATKLRRRREIPADNLILAAIPAFGATVAVLAAIVAIAVGAVAIAGAVDNSIGAAIVAVVVLVVITAGLVVTAAAVAATVVTDDEFVDVVLDFALIALRICRRLGKSARRSDAPAVLPLDERPRTPTGSREASIGVVQELWAISNTTP
ncbi:hypothetical protein [Nocardia alni]|uniref:hypothetical protein n=1 Tax=Nocardia alni TaxID=2815723 RepID=UPI001C2202EA|nr:hypothetical protein [Nocardia alni]